MPKLHSSSDAAFFLPIFPWVGKLPRHMGVLLPFIICFGQDFSKCLVIRATDAVRGQKCQRYFGCRAPVGSHVEQSPAVVPILRLLSETEFWSVLISSHPLPFKMYLRVNLRLVRHRCRLMLLLIIHRLASSCAQLLCFFALTPPAYRARRDMKETVVFPFLMPLLFFLPPPAKQTI